LFTPEAVHYGRAKEMWEQRKIILREAYAAHPERFVRKIPEPAPLPTAVWINPPEHEKSLEKYTN
jgi:putative transposase